MLSYSLKYSIKLECYCCTCYYYCISKLLSPVTTQSPSATSQSLLSHISVTTQSPSATSQSLLSHISVTTQPPSATTQPPLSHHSGGKARWGAMQTSQHQPCALSGTQLRTAKRTNQPHTHTKPLPPRFPSEVRAAAHIYNLTPRHKKKTAPLPMLSYSLKYSIKLECYCCTCCYYSISKFLSPVTTQSPSVTTQSLLSHHSGGKARWGETGGLRQEGKRGGVPCRPANTNHARFPAHTHAPQSAPTNPTLTQNPSHRAFPPKCEPQPISTPSHLGTKKDSTIAGAV